MLTCMDLCFSCMHFTFFHLRVCAKNPLGEHVNMNNWLILEAYWNSSLKLKPTSNKNALLWKTVKFLGQGTGTPEQLEFTYWALQFLGYNFDISRGFGGRTPSHRQIFYILFLFMSYSVPVSRCPETITLILVVMAILSNTLLVISIHTW